MDLINLQNIEKFSEKNILVVGDLMLDKHIHGKVSRISPEAPVIVLKVEKESFNPGGAANLANNLVSLGAKVFVAGTIGDDNSGKILKNKFQKSNIDTSLILTTQKPTTQKIRGMSNQHLFRIDYEDNSPINSQEEQKILSLIKEKIQEINAIILSDYNKGTLTENLVKNIISLAKQNNKLITADCKPKNFRFYKNIDLLKPNKKEAIEMTNHENIENAGRILQEKLNTNVIITKGSEGISIFEKNNGTIYLPTNVKEVYDVAGAGDTVLATLTLSLISGYNLVESTKLANRAAEIVVGKRGVTPIKREELQNN